MAYRKRMSGVMVAQPLEGAKMKFSKGSVAAAR